MATFEITKVNYAGGVYSSVVLLDQNGKLVLPPSLFLAEQAIRGQSPHTISNYAYRLNSFFEVLQYSTPSIDWKEVTQEQMDTYLNKYLKETLKLKSDSLSGHVAAISKFYDYASEFGFLSSPMALCFDINPPFKELGDNDDSREDYIKDSNELIEKYINPESFEELLGFIDEKNDYYQERNELILLIGYHMGLRAAEVVDPRNLRISKLWDKSSKTVLRKVNIVGKGEKTRTVTIPYLLQEKIKRFLLGRRSKIKGGLLICKDDGTALNRTFASKKFREAAANSGKAFFEQRSYHCLRHSFATNLVIFCYQEGFDPWTVVPEQMGHEDYQTTFKYVFFEAVLNKRHSILRKLSVTAKDIGRKPAWERGRKS